MFMSRLCVAAIAACVCAIEAPTVSQSRTASLPAIYYDDFEAPWALKTIVENDFVGLQDFERVFLRAYIWGVDDFVTRPPKRTDPACARLVDPVLHRRIEALGWGAARNATSYDISNPNVFANVDAMARRMQSVKTAQKAGREDMLLLAVDYGGCSGAVVTRFLANLKSAVSRGVP